MCTEDLNQMLNVWNDRRLTNGGFWHGNYFMENYRDCKDFNIENKYPYTGEYCRIIGHSELNGVFEAGLCVPSTCRAEIFTENISSLAHYIKERIFPHKENIEDFNIETIMCENDYSYPWINPLTITILFFGIATIIGTFYDRESNKKYGGFHNLMAELLNCCSIKRNIRVFLRPQEKIKCLDFFRVYGMMYNMFLHVYTSYCDIEDFRPFFSSYGRNMDFRHRLLANNGFTTVDIFLILSGFLVGYKFPKGINANRKGLFILLYFYLLRYIRLTPLVSIIAQYRYFLASSVSGPIAIPIIREIMKQDYDYGWLKLMIYRNDFSIAGNYTRWFPWLWYVIVDTRLYIIAPFYVLMIQRNRKLGLLVAISAIIFSCANRCITTYGYFTNQIYATFKLEDFGMETGTYQDVRLFLAHSEMYYSPWYRIGPFLVGILAGEFQQTKAFDLKLSEKQVKIRWTLSLCSIFVLSTVFCYPNSSSHWFIATFIYGLRPTLLAVAISWIILADANNFKGPRILEQFLSLKFWNFQGRLSYCFYICHPVCIYYFLWNLETSIAWSAINWVVIFFGILPFVYITSFILHLSVELPMMQFGKFLLQTTRSINVRHKTI